MRPIKAGKGIRMSFSRQKEVLQMPNLIEIQKDSYDWFLGEGLREVFRDIFPIEDFAGHLSLDFVDFQLYRDEAKYSIAECKERDATYAAPMKVKVRLYNKDKDEHKEHEVFMGDLPLMTDTGSFVINGAERVIVSQLVRSPGIYYTIEHDKVGKECYFCQVIPNRGAWLEYETDSNDVFNVRVDRTRKVPVTVLLRALGLGTNAEIKEMFGDEPKLEASFLKDSTDNYSDGLLELYRKIRPGEPLSVESARGLLDSMFFDPRRYDLARVGRYKFNKKLHLKNRVVGKELLEAAVDPNTGEILAESGTILTRELATEIQDAGIPFVIVRGTSSEDRRLKVLSNLMVDIRNYVDMENPTEYGIVEPVYYPALMKVIREAEANGADVKKYVQRKADELIPKHITREDIFASINYNMQIEEGIGTTDDIDHLGNRRIRAVGELLQNQYRIGLSRMERVVRERMTTQDISEITPQSLINIKPVTAAVKEFFGSSQLSQFMDQNNPLAGLTHKRRLSALGPGGLSRDRAGMEVRDVHPSHYGRMCPIETPEGPNIGLIGSLATYGRINSFGFIETPYRVVTDGRVTDEVRYLTADDEKSVVIAQANAPLNADRTFAENEVLCRAGDGSGEAVLVAPGAVQYMDVSPRQMVSVATALIPYLEHDDANRALMGANMQRQAVPLLESEAPVVGTGMEKYAALDSGDSVLAKKPGVVSSVDAKTVIVRNDDGSVSTYPIMKFSRSNPGNCYNQRVVVKEGQRVEYRDVIADGPSTDGGELALGKNLLVAYMPWEGLNYEDAIILSQRMVSEDVLTSIHIEEHEIDARDTKLGPEEITRDIPNVSEDVLSALDERGIIHIGAEVEAGDILVGKVTPKGETELTPEERLLRAIFGEKSREVRDTSLKVPHGESGTVIGIRIFDRENNDEDDLPPGVNQLVRVYVAQKRKITDGDKLAGRHGNKGVISKILPIEDMPFLEDGTPVDVILNPLGVPGRMNIGQVLEVHTGWLAKQGWKIEGEPEWLKHMPNFPKESGPTRLATPVFDGAHEDELFDLMDHSNPNRDGDRLINRSGKARLIDGRSGEPFPDPISVGYQYILKLHHLVDDKIHARSTGPYSMITQQPLGGKAQFGGQRFGEMEVWALEAYGAAYTLQEILTVKSDDVAGRVKVYEAIVKGENIPEPGIPESFKVLIKEMQSLCLNVEVLSTDGKIIEMSDSEEEGFRAAEDMGVSLTHDEPSSVDEA